MTNQPSNAAVDPDLTLTCKVIRGKTLLQCDPDSNPVVKVRIEDNDNKAYELSTKPAKYVGMKYSVIFFRYKLK
jgi:hypothetical protein